ncbi:MAG: complex I NDUFA9 subunit family protein [Hyphomicrobium sp.]
MTGSGKLAVVFGGSGFVGRHTVSALAKRGYRVRAAVRRPDLAGHLQPMGAVGQIHAVQANLRYPESVARAVAGADVVINLVAVLAPTGAQSFEALHVDGARAVAKAAREAGAKRLIHVSAIGADVKGKSNYARTKAAGEQAVLQEFPGAVIVRPSIVFGPEDQFFNRFAGMARISPMLPLIGSGLTKFQPVYVGDLAAALANVADGQGIDGNVYEIGGPEKLSFRQLLDRTLAYTGRSRAYMPMPFWLATLQALATWPLPNAMRPITVDQVRSLKVDNIVSDAAVKEGRTLKDLGVTQPASIATIVPGYLERFKTRGQYAHYRNA